jgi:hypothetical protein
MKVMIMRPATLALCGVVLASACDLSRAGFGRDCDDDADCADTTGAALVCFEGTCLTEQTVLALTPSEPLPEPLPEPTGESCGSAIPVTLGVEILGSTGAATNDHQALCGGSQAGELAYVVRLATATNLRVDLDPTGFDGALYASTSLACELADIIECQNSDSNVGGVETLLLPGVGPGDVFIIVDGADNPLATTAGAFSLTVREDLGCPVGSVARAGTCIGIEREVDATVPRTNMTATLLDSGKVLVTGGRTGADLATTTTAEVFDPATNTFTATTSMSTGRARHSAERTQDGRVVVIGGVTGNDDDGYTPTSSVEVWDESTGQWTPAPALPRRRDLFSATQMGGGRGIVVIGGRDGATTLRDVLVLDDDLTGWTAKQSLAEARFGHLALSVNGGDDVVVVGGRTGADALALDSVELYDFDDEDITPQAAMRQTRAAACGVRVGGDVVVFGGYQGSFADGFTANLSAEIFDVADDAWSSVFQNMSEPRLFATATNVPGLGVVVVAGGQDAPTATVELFDVADERFFQLPPLRHARLAHAAVALRDGRLLVVGGDGGDEIETVPLATAELIGDVR